MTCVRQALLAVVLTVAVADGFAAVQAVRKPLVSDPKRPGVSREIFFTQFDNASLNLEYVLRDGKIVHERWGDYFFGLQLGYSPRNGGWNRWDFLQVYAKTKQGEVNILKNSGPTLFTGYRVGGTDRVTMGWKTPDGGSVRLTLVSASAYKDWLFASLECEGLNLTRIELSAYPGNAAEQEGRERHFATKEKDWNLSVEAAEFVPQSSAALIYSRYFDERYGEKFVYDASSVARIRVGRASTSVGLRLIPKPDARRFAFALGHFADADPSDQLVRFIGEDADSVHDFLLGLDFKAMPEVREFRRVLSIALSMGVDKETLRAVKERYVKAAAAGDISMLSRCFDEVAELRRQKTEAELLKLM